MHRSMCAINNSHTPLYLLNYLYYELFTCMENILTSKQISLGVNTPKDRLLTFIYSLPFFFFFKWPIA